jgi:hypothetical protein
MRKDQFIKHWISSSSWAAQHKPQNVLVVPIVGGVRITWTASSEFETEIYANEDGGACALIATIGLNIGTYDYTCDLSAHIYLFQLRFKDDNTILNVPISLATIEILGGVRLTWDDNNTEADHFEIWANVAGAGFALLTTVEDGVQTIDHVVAVNITVVYKIRAKEGTLPLYSEYSDVNTITTTYAQDLILRMIDAGEELTVARKAAITTCINSLRATSLFETQFDDLIVTRGKGLSSTKLNWINHNFTALGVANGGILTYTEDIGYHSDGTNSYIRTLYTPSTNGSLYKLNDACFLLKTSGTIGAGSRGVGMVGSGGDYSCHINDTYVRLNSSVYQSSPRVIGYDCITRNNNTKVQHHQNAGTAELNIASAHVPDKEMLVLALKLSGVPAQFNNTTEVLEIYAFGKFLSQADFLVFQGIMNTYFAAL